MAEEKLTLKTFLESSQFIKGAKKVKTALSNIGKVASTLGATMTTAMAVKGVKAMIELAGEAEKTDLRFKRVFSSMSTEVETFATSLSNDLGRVESDIKSGMVSFQAFFQGLGFGSKEAAEMSKNMQALSLDLASFFQLQDANAQKRFLAALAGSPEVLDQFGINLKEARLEQELLNMGITTSVQKTNEMIKTNARLSVIMKAMTANGIVGDAERTMFTYSNTVTRAGASLKELGIAIGDIFIPIAKDFLESIISMSDALKKFFDVGAQKQINLTKEQADQYKILTHTLTTSEKETASYAKSLDKLLTLYPQFLGELKETIVTQDQLIKRSDDLKIAFEQQKGILSKTSEIEKAQEKYDELSKVLEDVNKRLSKAETGEHVSQRARKIASATTQKADADKEAIKAEKELNRLIEERAKLIDATGDAYEVIYGGGKLQEAESTTPLPNQLSPSFGKKDSLMAMVDSMAIAGDLSESLSTIPENIKPIKLLWKDYFSLGGIEFVRDTISENGKLIQNSFIEFDQTMANALEGFASNMGQAFGGAIQTALKGGANLGTAIRLATKEALGGMAADLAANAMYFGILALGYKAGIIATGGATGASAASAAKSAGIFAAGAALLGGVSAAISGKGGGGTTPSSRNTGGGANGGTGVGGGTFEDFMDSIRGEQVFRLAGNDLVMAINRTNKFQGSIGG